MDRLFCSGTVGRIIAIFFGCLGPITAQASPYPSVDLKVPGLSPTALYTNPADSTIRAVLERDQVWEDLETRWILHTIRAGDVFVDVGANIGYYTVIAAKTVGDQGHVYAFEPDPTSFAILKANVERNGLANVTLEQKALSNEPGSLRLFLAHQNKGDHRIFDEDGAARPFLDVEALRLDDYAPLKGKKVDFIKVDTQGAEGIILEGMTDTIAANPNMAMVMEYTPSSLQAVGTDPAEFLAKLQKMDFRFFNLGMGFGRIVPPALRASSLHTTGDQFTNLYLLPGLARLQAMDSRVGLASDALETAASNGNSASWESATRAELDAHPWRAPAASLHTFDPTSPAVEGRDGCVELSAAGPYRLSLPELPAGATALRMRTRATGDASGFVGIREIALFPAVGSTGRSLARTPMYRPRDPEVPLFAGAADLRLRPVGPDIVQMSLPEDLTAVAGHTLEVLLEWPDQVPGRLCVLVSTMPRPLSFDAEIALRIPVAKRDSRMQTIVLESFAQRSPQFASLRETLLAAEKERAEFQSLTPEAVQGWIREPQGE